MLKHVHHFALQKRQHSGSFTAGKADRKRSANDLGVLFATDLTLLQVQKSSTIINKE